MLDVDRLMTGLAETRPIFHNEADFQHALAWQIHQELPDLAIRLEFNPDPDSAERRYLDIWLPTVGTAIELKYLTRRLDVAYDGERFALRDQGAQDIRRHDFLKDAQRLEQAIEQGQAKAGLAVLLTNDPSYWTQPDRLDTIDADFRIHEGREITGNLAWSENASKGTTEGKEEPIIIHGSYILSWQDYATLPEGRYAQFRYLAVKVGD